VPRSIIILPADVPQKHTVALLSPIRDCLAAKGSTLEDSFQLVVDKMAISCQPRAETANAARNFFLWNFPAIQLQSPADAVDTAKGKPLVWGWVYKNDEGNQIYIRKDVVHAYEEACDGNLQYVCCSYISLLDLTFWQLNSKWQLALILLVTTLHEISHAMTKYIFNGANTPEEQPFDSSEDTAKFKLGGESGWAIEDAIFGFRLQVEWSWDDRGDMNKIRRLIALGPDGETRILSMCSH
jgi:hypothetical protein